MNQTISSIFMGLDSKKIAAIAIFFLALLAFIWELIAGVYSVDEIKTETKPLNLAVNQAPIRADSPLFRVAVFGDYVPLNLSEGDIKKSMLDVEVVGVLFASKENESQVILKLAGGKEEPYSIGDSLPGGAIIKRISKEGILVLHNGVLESLSFPKNELIFDSPAKPLIKNNSGHN